MRVATRAAGFVLSFGRRPTAPPSVLRQRPSIRTLSMSALPPTKLLYFDDSFLLSAEATVLAVLPPPDATSCWKLALDSTVFYPFGGGQPADAGHISALGASLSVSDVRLTDGVVLHSLVALPPAELQPGVRVSLQVDAALRLLHARIHSAGHLLDVALVRCGFALDGGGVLTAGKGMHTPQEMWVEYAGKVPPEQHAPLIEQLNAKLVELLAAGGAVTASQRSYAEATELCRSYGPLPAYWKVDSSPRVVLMADSGCPCGGTHVQSLSQLGRVTVTAIRVKKGVTRISYALS